jgi:DNA-binding transcriptional MerR regulator
MPARNWKIGELARRTGLTVRTLHHYDALGLLQPSARTGGGHRVYTARDVVRLQQIVSLRQMGFPLAEIGRLLKRRDVSAVAVLRAHLARLRDTTALQQRLCSRIEAMVSTLEARGHVSTEDFLRTIEVTGMFDKYFSPEQLAWIKDRREQIGEAHIREVEAEWPALIAAVRAEMQKGTDAGTPEVQALARRWVELVREFTAGRADIAQGVARVYKNEPSLGARTNLDGELFAYVQRAMAAGGLTFDEPSKR